MGKKTMEENEWKANDEVDDEPQLGNYQLDDEAAHKYSECC